MPVIGDTKLQRALRLVTTEEEGRAVAAKQIQEIAGQYPDLFERYARQFIEFVDEPGTDLATNPAPVIRLLPGNDKMTPTDAIFKWLDQYKEGTPNEIVRALIHRIETDSESPASIVYSTLGSLKKRGKVTLKPKAGSKSGVFCRS